MDTICTENIYPKILFDTEIPQIIFGILGLSITIATFLPALIYSYNNELLKSLNYPVIEKSINKWQRIISFIYTTDLLLTQSMIQVAFSAFYGLILFTDYTLKFSELGKVFFICLPIYLGIFFHWYFGYHWSLIKLYELFKDLIKSNRLRFWDEGKKIKKWWKICSLLNLFTTTLFIFLIFFILLITDKTYCRSHLIILFMCIESLILILLAISWIFPLVKYKPLMAEVEDFIKLYEEEVENKNNNNSNC